MRPFCRNAICWDRIGGSLQTLCEPNCLYSVSIAIKARGSEEPVEDLERY
jgi:hypothetical protein